MDPSTFRIMFDVSNTDNAAGHRLRPLGGPWAFFSRMRALAGGQILEDIDMYSRVHEIFNIFIASDSRQNEYAEGFGTFWDNTTDREHVSASNVPGIPASASQTVMFKPLKRYS